MVPFMFRLQLFPKSCWLPWWSRACQQLQTSMFCQQRPSQPREVCSRTRYMTEHATKWPLIALQGGEESLKPSRKKIHTPKTWDPLHQWQECHGDATRRVSVPLLFISLATRGPVIPFRVRRQILIIRFSHLPVKPALLYGKCPRILYICFQ